MVPLGLPEDQALKCHNLCLVCAIILLFQVKLISTRNYPEDNIYPSQNISQTASSNWPMGVSQGSFMYQPETLGNEFSVLTYVASLI